MAVSYNPAGLLLQRHIADRCNFRCTHCYQDSFAGGEPDYPGLLAILKQYKELPRCLSNALTGSTFETAPGCWLSEGNSAFAW